MYAVFRKALRDSRRITLWLSVGLSVYLLSVLAFYPPILEQQEELDKLIQNFPKELIGVFTGGLDLQAVSLADPGVYLHGQFLIWMILFLGALTIAQAFNAITNAERDGTLDVIMSFPITRREMLLARFANSVVTVLLVLTACFITLFIGTQIITEFELNLGQMLLVIYGAFFVIIIPGAVAYMLAAIVPSSKRWPGAVVYTFFIGSYLLLGFASSIDLIGSIRGLLIFDYYSGGDLVNQGADIADWVILTGTAAFFAAVAWWSIDRKQLGV